jgi:anti-sigma B factor antagonist
LVRLRGELDLATASAFEHRLGDLVRDGARFVILDLSAVSFCDVTGLNALLRLEAVVRSHDGRLRLLGPCRWVDTMVRLLRLTDRLAVEQPPAGDGVANGDGFRS